MGAEPRAVCCKNGFQDLCLYRWRKAAVCRLLFGYVSTHCSTSTVLHSAQSILRNRKARGTSAPRHPKACEIQAIKKHCGQQTASKIRSHKSQCQGSGQVACPRFPVRLLLFFVISFRVFDFRGISTQIAFEPLELLYQLAFVPVS